MAYQIVLAPEAVDDLKRLRANVRGTARDAFEEYLRHQPTRVSKARIKRLRGLSRPQFRLRVGEVRIFYDVSGKTVEILAVVLKSEADAWLRRVGESR